MSHGNTSFNFLLLPFIRTSSPCYCDIASKYCLLWFRFTYKLMKNDVMKHVLRCYSLWVSSFRSSNANKNRQLLHLVILRIQSRWLIILKIIFWVTIVRWNLSDFSNLLHLSTPNVQKKLYLQISVIFPNDLSRPDSNSKLHKSVENLIRLWISFSLCGRKKSGFYSWNPLYTGFLVNIMCL